MISSEVNSSSKKWLIRIFVFLIVLDVIRLINGILSSSGVGIGSTSFSFLIDGIMLLAILRQWKVILQIGRIVLIIDIVLGLIVEVLGIIEIVGNKLEKSEKYSLISGEVVLAIQILCYFILAKLIGKYTTELKGISNA
uniref:Uncharacterized protein n=1 Tax=Tetranychus urticae TaxID=32264 RepID=T1K570_TETUR